MYSTLGVFRFTSEGWIEAWVFVVSWTASCVYCVLYRVYRLLRYFHLHDSSDLATNQIWWDVLLRFERYQRIVLTAPLTTDIFSSS